MEVSGSGGSALGLATLFDAAKIFQQCGGIGIAKIGILGQSPGNYPGERAGNILERWRLGMDDSGNRCGKTSGLKGLRAAKHLVKNQAQGEKIGASIVGLLKKYLGRHVRRCAAAGGHGLHTLRGVVRVGAPGASSYAEVENLHPVARGQHDVFGLDIAVNDAFFVGGLQAFTALRGNREKFLG
jgi:hypothetical protein